MKVRGTEQIELGTFGKRFEALRHHYGDTVDEFLERMGISRGGYYTWIKEDEPVREAVGAVALRLPEVNVRWLNYGEGEITGPVPAGDGTPGALPAKPGNDLLVRGGGYFENAETGVLTIYDGSDVQAGAGSNGFGFEVFEDTAIEVRYYQQMMYDLLGFWPPENMRGMRVAGHSMMPTIEPGQLVLYNPMRNLEGIITRRRYIISLMNVKTETWTPMAKQIVRRSTDGFRIVSENRSLGEPDTVLLAEKGQARYTRQDSGERVEMAVLGEILWPQPGESDRSKKVIAETLEVLAAEGALQPAGR